MTHYSHTLISWIAWIISILTITAVPLNAQSNPVNSTREALQNTPDLPWYDPASDKIRPAEPVIPPPPPEIRGPTWRTPERKPLDLPNFRWRGFYEFLGLLIKILVGLLLIGLCYLFVRMILRNDQSRSSRNGVDYEEDIVDQNRIEDLPFQIATSRGDFLGDARRLADAGEYGQAIVYLFSHQLLQLDRYQHIRLARGKTNRQYLRELRSRRDLADLLMQTILPFEDYFFGNYKIERERFEACWSQVETFRKLVQSDNTMPVGTSAQ